jgi:peptide/nickel transport system permease protein
MPILLLLARRFLFLIPTLLGVLFLTFTLSFIIPGDPTTVALGPRATPEQRARFRQHYALDRPVLEQYVRYVRGIVRGDLGDSLHTGRPVIRDLANLWPATFELANAAMLLTVLVGLPSGIIAARARDRVWDHVARAVSTIGLSMPIFWLGLLALLVFSLWLGLFPAGGRLSIGLEPPPRVTGMYLIDSLLAAQWPVFRDALHHLVLPAVVLSCAVVGTVSRMARNAVLEVLHQDYIRTARAKGVSEASILFRHALRNALLAVLTVSGILYAQLLSGAVLTETIFSWPGVGRYTVEAILQLDYSPILGVAIVTSFIYMLVNLTVDLLYVFVDPRLRS